MLSFIIILVLTVVVCIVLFVYQVHLKFNKRLFLLFSDKFDQFWAVNRKLMELGSEDSFKYVPFRCYYKDEHMIQKLIRPVTDNGDRKNLQDMLKELCPDKTDLERCQFIYLFLLPVNRTLLWLFKIILVWF